MTSTPLNFLSLTRKAGLRRGVVFGSILILALLSFEIFNYSTTDFALTDLLGAELRFAGIRWATILSIAFCGIDFAGIARLFTPEQGRDEPAEVWYLFAAWLLAAAMNALLTWWGVAVAVRTHTALAGTIMSEKTLTSIIPVFVAVMVWIIRVLIIGTFSLAGERIFSVAESRPSGSSHSRPVPTRDLPRPSRPLTTLTRPAPKPEPTYHPVGISSAPRAGESQKRMF